MSERFSYAGDMLGPRERFEPFVTTQWTVVLAAGDEDSSATVRDALERLCETYWYPLYAFARRKGCSPHLSEDLVQGFFAQMLRLKSLGKASRERGRFRSFLLASFQHYIADAYARSKAQKRGGDRAILSLDAVQAEERYTLEPVDQNSPSELYDRRWALTLLEDTLNDLSAVYQKEGKDQFFNAFKGILSGIDGSGSYAEWALELGITEASVKMGVMRMKQRYRALLIQRIRATVESEGDVSDELAHLMQALGGK
jgi:RNA polymerase sigma-70 factor (ECF subfamily)